MTTNTLAKLMKQAQVFASAWSLVGGRLDSGNGLEEAEAAKAELREMIHAALTAQAPAQQAHWYSLSTNGMATLCTNEDDARNTAKNSQHLHPRNGPYRAVQMAPVAQQAAQATALTDHEIETLAHRMCWRYKHDGDSYGDPAYTFNKVTLIDFVRRVGAGSVSGWPALLAGAALQQSVATMESAAAHLESLPKMHQGKLLAHDLRRAASCCETAIESIQQATQPQAARTTEGI